MKKTAKHALFTLTVTGLLAAGQATATVVEFISGEGYADGDLTNNAAWFGDTGGNVVANAAAGYDGALGTVTLGATSADEWVTDIYNESFNLSQNGATLTVSSRFQYSTTGAAMSANQAAIISFQFFDDSADLGGDFIRLGLRRMLTEQLRFFGAQGPAGGGTQSGAVVDEAAVGLTPSAAGTSDWLELSATLIKGSSSNDWTLIAELMNLVTTNLVLSHTFTGISPNAGFQDDPTLYGAINSSRSNEVSQTTNRLIDNFSVIAGFIPPPPAVVTIIGGAIGNGDFSAGGAVPAGAQTYNMTTNWFNAQGGGADEDVNFTNDSQMGGSTDPSPVTRGGMPFNNRTQVNDTGYMIVAPGQVFSLSYDFGAGGNSAGWDADDTTNQTFLFTTTNLVDAVLTTNDMVELGGDSYPVDRDEGQWTQRSVPVFYTTTVADVGKTVYFGMRFEDFASPSTLFPRIDFFNLQVTVPAAPDGPLLAVERNGASLDVSWESDTGINYQLQTNSDLTTTNWTDQGSAVAGDGSVKTNSVPLSGDELYIRTEVQ